MQSLTFRPIAAFITLLAATCFSGCSYLGMDSAAPETKPEVKTATNGSHIDHHIDGLLISYSRSTLGRTDFEQYRLAGDQLIWECGRISAGRYNPQTQKVSIVPPATLATIKDLGAKIHRLVTEKGSVFEKPGTTPEFFDPGQFTLVLEQAQTPATVKTTFDSVAIPNANREQLLNKLTLAVRSVVVAEKPCGIEEFYLLAKPRTF